MIARKLAAAALASLCALPLVTAAPAAAEEVYMIRGFMNVFSRGMDEMTARLRANGVNVKSMSNGQWSGVANDIIRRSKAGQVSYPIIIAGHSVGGQEAPRMANALEQAGVPVALVVGVDPGFAPPPPFTVGSARVVNYWIAGSARGNPYRTAGAFAGPRPVNIDIRPFSRADHVGIDKDPAVQARIIGDIMSAIGR